MQIDANDYANDADSNKQVKLTPQPQAGMGRTRI
jgi:hypothetical protein